jgi:hypothetical protein
VEQLDEKMSERRGIQTWVQNTGQIIKWLRVHTEKIEVEHGFRLREIILL